MNFITNTKSLTILLFLACFYLIPIKTIDTITSSTPIKDPQTILSNGNISKLGFFTPENSTKRYLGIWLNQISAQTIIWIANRDKPLNNSSGLFTLSQDGNLVLTDGENETLWSSNLSNVVRNSSARLLDSGNLVLQDLSTGIPTWESFKHPCDKLLPKMKFTTNLITKEKIQLVSWRTSLNPSMGNFSLALDARLPAEAVILKNGELHYRTGPWNGQIFLGIPGMDSSYLYGFSLVSEDGISTFSYANISDPLEMTLFLTPQGNLEQKQWNKEGKDWIAEWTAVKNECDVYGACGKFGICNSIKLPICSCLKGYEPMNVEEWNRQNWTSGCVRKKLLKCERESSNMSGNGGKEDGFLTLKMVKVPYFAIYLSDPYTEEDCRYQCLLNCTCNAYSYESRFGCMLWNDNLIDMQQFLNGDTELYLRLAASELDTAKNITIIVSVSVMSGFLTLVICIYFLWKWRVKQRGGKKSKEVLLHNVGEPYLMFPGDNMRGDTLFQFEKLATATNNFSLDNKLGQGGFGPVYKGKFSDKQEIAVKRLSKASEQGVEEFTNEVIVMSKLHHRNVVRLLGCCVETGERMLIYEYMPNRSLDSFLFDPSKSLLLDWRKRFSIIEGIARGLLYLHRDSTLRIIHRDLKASNILLDVDLNPKISDFGMARIFGCNQDQANTKRVMGTYGYMAPEYAMAGRFSEKSDVFSYGVLLLEIVCGRKNSSFYQDEYVLSLLEYAWKLWNEDNITALADRAILDSAYEREIVRCIHLGLLCVQESAIDRPNVSTIISILRSEIVEISPPNKPAFTDRQISDDTEFPENFNGRCSTNKATITVVEGR